MPNHWDSYYANTAERKPRRLLSQALKYTTGRNWALDFGSGAFIDSVYLLQQGFTKVYAVDGADSLTERAAKLRDRGLTFKCIDFNNFNCPPNSYDLISAQNSLSFLSPANADRVVSSLLRGLTSGGVFTGNFFGPSDGWNQRGNMTFFSEGRIRRLLDELEIIYFEEEEFNRSTASGKMKNWHWFKVIAVRVE